MDDLQRKKLEELVEQGKEILNNPESHILLDEIEKLTLEIKNLLSKN